MHSTSFLMVAMAALATAADRTTSTSTTRSTTSTTSTTSTATSVQTFGAGADWAASISGVPKITSTAASVVGINNDLTTFRIGCMDKAPKSDCDISKPWTVIQGPNTFSFTGNYTAATTAKVGTVTVNQDFKCTFTSSSSSASCAFKETVTGTHSGTTHSTTTTASTSKLPTVTYHAMPVTAGGEKLPASKTTTTSHSTSTGGAARAWATAGPMGAIAAVAIGALL